MHCNFKALDVARAILCVNYDILRQVHNLPKYAYQISTQFYTGAGVNSPKFCLWHVISVECVGWRFFRSILSVGVFFPVVLCRKITEKHRYTRSVLSGFQCGNRATLQGEHKKVTPYMTFVNISAMHEDFCMRLYMLNSKILFTTMLC